MTGKGIIFSAPMVRALLARLVWTLIAWREGFVDAAMELWENLL